MSLGEILFIPGVNGSITESQWEALEEYDWDRTYNVKGVGTYLGPTLITAAPWVYEATDLHVSKSGNDANPGTFESPKLTIWAAFNSISTSNTAPITVWVDSGTYEENASGGYFLFSKVFANMVTVRGRPGTLPVIQNTSGSFVIRPNGVENVRFRNLEIKSSTATLGFVYSTQSLTNFELIECVFTDENSRNTAISLSHGTQSNISIKRCVFSSSGAFNRSILTAANSKIIGNNFDAIAVANSTTVSGSSKVNSNHGTLTALALNGLASGSGSNHTANANRVRNIVHAGGDVGFESVLNFDRNIINATTGVRGIAVSGYTAGGGVRNNTIVSLGDTGLGWPIDGVTSDCDGHVISQNNITNNGSGGHAILVSTGGSNATISGNTTTAAAGGSYGLVLKGTSNTATGNTFGGGINSGILLKDCTGGVVRNNLVNSSVAGSVALRFDNSVNGEVTENTFVVTDGLLYSNTIANIGAGNVVNSNSYSVSGSAVWGSLFGSTLNSLADAQAAWAANYTPADNDSLSVSL